MTDLMLFDTFSGQKRPLVTLVPGRCGIYCCGPTTYDVAHIGHARAALAPDILVRFLRYQGVEVKYVRNVTDIDDNIIRRAAEVGEAPGALSRRYAAAYLSDMTQLNCVEPDVIPLVTEHIPEILALVNKLVDKGLAYAVDGDVYFRVKDFEGYGKLSKRNLDDMLSGARVSVDTRKENACDFALWKAAKEGEPSWDSPWGKGRPGWHIECSAMSAKHLGETFDIHTGGRDLIFPHHENEIAQSQGCNGHDSFAKTWIHNGFVDFAGEKMSKSLGNFFTIAEVTKLYHPEALRYFLMSVQYRGPVSFEVEVQCPSCAADMCAADQECRKCSACGTEHPASALKNAVRFPGLTEADERIVYVYETLLGARRLLDQVGWPESMGGDVAGSVASMLKGFETHMRDDLNTAGAVGALSEGLKEANRLVQSGKGTEKTVRYRTLAHFVLDMEKVSQVLGVFEKDPMQFLTERRERRVCLLGVNEAQIDGLVADRDEARQTKDWARADEVRAELDALKVRVQDTPNGSFWTV